MKEKLRDVYNEVGSEIVVCMISIDRSGSMVENNKWDLAVNGYKTLVKSIRSDSSLLSSCLLGTAVFGNKVELVNELNTADNDIDFTKYAPTNEGTHYFENEIRVTNYSLQCARNAQKAGKEVKGLLKIYITDGRPTDSFNKLEAKERFEKAQSKGIITIALAVGDDCNIDLLKKYSDHVFKVDDAEGIQEFFEKVVLNSIATVSQSIAGDAFEGEYISGTAEIKEVEKEDVDDEPAFKQLK